MAITPIEPTGRVPQCPTGATRAVPVRIASRCAGCSPRSTPVFPNR
ncbi:MAG TPA: hypothetical protein VF646_12190 [Cytophagales bacterium]